jgi:hypothetical protein
MPDEKVQSLGNFLDRVRDYRKWWNHSESSKELWFRGERRPYPTILRPQLYRPPRSNERGMKSVPEVLDIENDLYEDFQRCAIQLCNEKISDDDWDWDSYFLMQHHNAPTRLLDWSDGALMALHFAVRNKTDDDQNDAIVYVLEPYRLLDKLKALPDTEIAEQQWKTYVEKNPSDELSSDEWEDAYLPSDDEDRAELPLPRLPLLLDFSHITRRIAAQRSRLIVFGTDPDWLAEEFRRPESTIRAITIDAGFSRRIRVELRDSGITESVIYPDLDGLGREMIQVWDDRNSQR